MNSSISSSEPKNGLWLFAVSITAVMAILFVASEALVRGSVLEQDEFVAHVTLFDRATQTDAAFGDSHAARGFVPPPGMINLAYPSEGIEHIDWKIRAFYADKKPGRIVLQADPHLVAPYRLRRPLGGYPQRFADAGKPIGAQPIVTVPRFRGNLVNYWSSFFKSGGTLRSRIQVLDNGALLSPGNLFAETERWRLFKARERIVWHKIRPWAAVDRQLGIYRDLLTYLQDAGADVCLVTYPLSPDYREAMEIGQRDVERRARDKVLKFFADEAERIGGKYVDLRSDVTDRKKFRDVDHLNGDAASQYTSTIVSRCFGS